MSCNFLFFLWKSLSFQPKGFFFPILTFIPSGHNKIFREKRSFFRRITGGCALILYRTIVIFDSVGNFIFPREIFSSFPSPYGSANIILNRALTFIFYAWKLLLFSLAISYIWRCIVVILLFFAHSKSLVTRIAAVFPRKFFLKCAKTALSSLFLCPNFFVKSSLNS